MTYSFTCEQGHEPVTLTVEAENDEEALQKRIEQSAPHLQAAHPEMANVPEDQAKNIIMSNWVKQ